ncbi:hypothetical protein ACFLZN_00255 [Nanoarchaeota archaeon]
MGNEIDATTTQVKHRGYFNIDHVVKSIRTWMKRRKFNYLEAKIKYLPDEREFEITGDKKVNEYVKWEITVSIYAFDLKDVEVIKDGKKQTTTEGRIFLEVSGKMMLDWMKRFKGNKFLIVMQDFYHKYIIKHKLEDEWADDLDGNIFSLTKEIRHALEMEL